MSDKYFEYYHCYQNIIFNQIETIGAHECLKNILSIAIVIKILFFNQIETSAALLLGAIVLIGMKYEL